MVLYAVFFDQKEPSSLPGRLSQEKLNDYKFNWKSISFSTKAVIQYSANTLDSVPFDFLRYLAHEMEWDRHAGRLVIQVPLRLSRGALRL